MLDCSAIDPLWIPGYPGRCLHLLTQSRTLNPDLRSPQITIRTMSHANFRSQLITTSMLLMMQSSKSMIGYTSYTSYSLGTRAPPHITIFFFFWCKFVSIKCNFCNCQGVGVRGKCNFCNFCNFLGGVVHGKCNLCN